MSKTNQLHQWLLDHGDWAYLNEVPYSNFGMTRQSANETLTRLCISGRADFRVLGLKQYRAR